MTGRKARCQVAEIRLGRSWHRMLAMRGTRAAQPFDAAASQGRRLGRRRREPLVETSEKWRRGPELSGLFPIVQDRVRNILPPAADGSFALF